MRVALLESSGTAELALVVAAYSAARPARLVACYVELPTKLADGRTVTVNNNPRLGAFEPQPRRGSWRRPYASSRSRSKRGPGGATTAPGPFVPRSRGSGR